MKIAVWFFAPFLFDSHIPTLEASGCPVGAISSLFAISFGLIWFNEPSGSLGMAPDFPLSSFFEELPHPLLGLSEAAASEKHQIPQIHMENTRRGGDGLVLGSGNEQVS